MTPKKQRRLAFAITLLLAGGGAAALAVYALQDNVLFFYSPTDIADHPEKVPEGRMGGEGLAVAPWWSRF